jgi:hypothetical protein
VVINSTTFSAGGDSGSLIVTNDANCHQPVALLFAGSSTTTIGNPIGEVLSRVSSALGNTVNFVGGTCSASAAQESVANPALQGPSAQSVEVAINVMRDRVDDLMARDGVIGVGVSASDLNPADAAIVVYVDQTSTVRSRIPRWINGVRVVRVFTDPFVAY